jgi:hypothetical protein
VSERGGEAQQLVPVGRDALGRDQALKLRFDYVRRAPHPAVVGHEP